MSRIHLGAVEVWPDARVALHPDDVVYALEQHENGHCEEADLRRRWRILLSLLGKYGFWSEHTDRFGTQFAIITENEADPEVTHVILKTW